MNTDTDTITGWLLARGIDPRCPACGRTRWVRGGEYLLLGVAVGGSASSVCFRLSAIPPFPAIPPQILLARCTRGGLF